MRPDRLAETLGLTVLFTFVLLFVSRQIWNIDIFWHIAAGRWFLAHGEIPTTDIFSAIAPERTWVTFQWGYQVVVHLLDELGGLQLVRFAHAAVMVAATALVFIGARHRLSLGALASLTLTVLFVVLIGDRIRARPHVVNLLAWSILFPFLVRGPGRLDRTAIITTSAVVAVWANLHAGGALLFLIAAATLPAGAIGARILGVPAFPEPIKRSTIWYAAALIPALLSPHFIRGNIQALMMLEGSEASIGEWRPSWHFLHLAGLDGSWVSAPAHYVNGLAPTIVAALLAGVTLYVLRGPLKRRLQQIELWRLLLVLALVVLAHRSVRFVYVAVFAWVALIPALPLVKLSPPVRRGLVAVALVALSVASYRFNVTAQHGDLETASARAFGGEPLETRRFPTVQADFLAGTGFEGKVLCQPNWGGFLLWRLGEAVRVTADGRGNTERAVTEDLMLLYDRARVADPARLAVFERYPIDAVVHQHPVWPSGQEPAADTWTLVFNDPKGAIYIRHTEAGLAYLGRLAAMKASRQSPPGSERSDARHP